MPDEVTSTPAQSSTSAHDPIHTPEGREAHFEAVLAAALKEAPPPEPYNDMPDTTLAITEPTEEQADEATPPPAEAKEPEAEVEKPVEKPGTLFKARRLAEEGKFEEAWQEAFGKSMAEFEPTNKVWKAIKYHAHESKQQAQQLVQQAKEEAQRATQEKQHVITSLEPLYRAAEAYQKGDFSTFLKLATGDTPETFQRKLIGQLHEAPKADPVVLARLEAVERERAAERQANAQERERLAQEDARLRQASAQQSWVNEIKLDVSRDTRFTKVAQKPAFITKVLEIQRDNYSEKTKSTIDNIEAAELAWEELYGDLIPVGGQTEANPVPGVNGISTERNGQSVNKQTNLRPTQPTQAAPVGAQPYSRDNQDRLMEEAIRKAQSVLTAA